MEVCKTAARSCSGSAVFLPSSPGDRGLQDRKRARIMFLPDVAHGTNRPLLPVPASLVPVFAMQCAPHAGALPAVSSAATVPEKVTAAPATAGAAPPSRWAVPLPTCPFSVGAGAFCLPWIARGAATKQNLTVALGFLFAWLALFGLGLAWELRPWLVSRRAAVRLDPNLVVTTLDFERHTARSLETSHTDGRLHASLVIAALTAVAAVLDEYAYDCLSVSSAFRSTALAFSVGLVWALARSAHRDRARAAGVGLVVFGVDPVEGGVYWASQPGGGLTPSYMVGTKEGWFAGTGPVTAVRLAGGGLGDYEVRSKPVVAVHGALPVFRWNTNRGFSFGVARLLFELLAPRPLPPRGCGPEGEVVSPRIVRKTSSGPVLLLDTREEVYGAVGQATLTTGMVFLPPGRPELVARLAAWVERLPALVFDPAACADLHRQRLANSTWSQCFDGEYVWVGGAKLCRVQGTRLVPIRESDGADACPSEDAPAFGRDCAAPAGQSKMSGCRGGVGETEIGVVARDGDNDRAPVLPAVDSSWQSVDASDAL